jgi:hypothetical protein
MARTGWRAVEDPRRKQYTALIGGVPVAPDSVIFVSLCVSGDASRVVAETQQMIVHV